MGQPSNNLASLIGSRICHDLISPIGAIQNGIELLDLSGAVKGPEMMLIADSVGNAGARIRFFRIAFGASTDQALGRSEMTTVLEDMGRNARIKVRWEPAHDLTRAEVRLAFLAILCFETAMPYGGTVRVSHDGKGWTITGAAEKLSVNDALWDALPTRPDDPSPGPAEVTPAQVQFLLLPLTAQEQGKTIAVTRTDTDITLTV
ncbi:histidine phosphotransferase family protein [Chachezhania antarctica]|uniref:histidine phosphotransferase family protein n=1 Tax=Chachezhania antarctica TaxID=2340860 RepID=UPI000EAFD748|nr:histidine phosphotransferase family protein [Chachezhania antarctica]|tara:strand:- start:1344 stop:1955 length:612 start_codon:yes stop_codon:yes gene_type:complete